MKIGINFMPSSPIHSTNMAVLRTYELEATPALLKSNNTQNGAKDS
jgi:hypothetical protein